jgi:hypothetical protein
MLGTNICSHYGEIQRSGTLRVTSGEPTNVELKVRLLQHMRALWYEGSETSHVADVNMAVVADLIGIPSALVSGLLKELFALGLVDSTGQAPHLAYTDGRCQITVEGLKFLHDYEVSRQAPELHTQWGRVGFTVDE